MASASAPPMASQLKSSLLRSRGSRLGPAVPWGLSGNALKHLGGRRRTCLTVRAIQAEKKNVRVPQFGRWENDGSVPYTQYFEEARKEKNSTKMMNPNDPLENPEAFHQLDPPGHFFPPKAPSPYGSARAKHEHRKSRDDDNVHQAVNYMSTEPLSAHKLASGSPNRRYDQGNFGDTQKRSSRNNGELEYSIDRSPLHSHLHTQSASKTGISSPSREKRASSEKHGLAPNTPGRTRMKPSERNDYSVDKGSTVPKFGEWDVMDPASADSYSYIFNQVREEKHSGSGKPSSVTRDSKSDVQKRKTNSKSTDVCCFCFKK